MARPSGRKVASRATSASPLSRPPPGLHAKALKFTLLGLSFGIGGGGLCGLELTFEPFALQVRSDCAGPDPRSRATANTCRHRYNAFDHAPACTAAPPHPLFTFARWVRCWMGHAISIAISIERGGSEPEGVARHGRTTILDNNVLSHATQTDHRCGRIRAQRASRRSHRGTASGRWDLRRGCFITTSGTGTSAVTRVADR
jgi:hypothetical protein